MSTVNGLSDGPICLQTVHRGSSCALGLNAVLLVIECFFRQTCMVFWLLGLTPAVWEGCQHSHFRVRDQETVYGLHPQHRRFDRPIPQYSSGFRKVRGKVSGGDFPPWWATATVMAAAPFAVPKPRVVRIQSNSESLAASERAAARPQLRTPLRGCSRRFTVLYVSTWSLSETAAHRSMPDVE